MTSSKPSRASRPQASHRTRHNPARRALRALVHLNAELPIRQVTYQKIDHGGPSPPQTEWSCASCPKTFSRSDNARRHIRDAADEKHREHRASLASTRCLKCGSDFSSPRARAVHEKTCIPGAFIMTSQQDFAADEATAQHPTRSSAFESPQETDNPVSDRAHSLGRVSNSAHWPVWAEMDWRAFSAGGCQTSLIDDSSEEIGTSLADKTANKAPSTASSPVPSAPNSSADANQWGSVSLSDVQNAPDVLWEQFLWNDML